jgi:type IX secretion system PorP/SprF family membrane protein
MHLKSIQNLKLRMEKAKYSVILFLIVWQGLTSEGFSQQSALMTQYINNPLILNPAFAGNRNSLAIDVFSRQQWIGFENAPSSYYADIHLPLNKSMVSLGALARSDQAGPMIYNKLAFDYAYLIRVSRRAFLSLGVRGGVDHFNINLNRLQIIDFNDPEFSSDIKNEFRPSAGGGFVFFTQTIYFGFSIPHVSFAKMPWSSTQAIDFKTRNEYNIMGGLNFNITREMNVKFSLLRRIVQNEISTTDVSMMLRYEDDFSAGLTYRMDHAAGVIMGVKINDEMKVTYSYEVPTGWDPIINKGCHELTLSFDFTKYIIPNRNRRFLNKKIDKEEINSIRYF